MQYFMPFHYVVSVFYFTEISTFFVTILSESYKLQLKSVKSCVFMIISSQFVIIFNINQFILYIISMVDYKY